MRSVVRVLGWLCVALAVVLVVIGLTTLPSGGLMFALPYVFLIPGVLLGAAGGCLLWLGRSPGPEPQERGPQWPEPEGRDGRQ